MCRFALHKGLVFFVSILENKLVHKAEGDCRNWGEINKDCPGEEMVRTNPK